MKKIGIVLLTLCVLGLCIGVASAKPVWIDTLTLSYSADNGATWQSVDGSLAPGFKLYSATPIPQNEFYWLDVGTLDPIPDVGSYPFFLKTAPKGPYFKYWATRGVTADAALAWQVQMWKIINGQEPMFYLTCDETTCHLTDGLLTWAGQPTALLRINKDYFVGTYHFIGDVGGARTYIKLFFANP